jgi:hypothetical protein
MQSIQIKNSNHGTASKKYHHASGYDNMFICYLVKGSLYQHRLTMVNSKHVPVSSGRLNKIFRAGGVFADQVIIQREAIAHIGLFDCNKRFIC